jgi:hypothetical protein
MTVVNFDFSVVYIPGGQYKGKGQYLAGIAILPTNIDVSHTGISYLRRKHTRSSVF